MTTMPMHRAVFQTVAAGAAPMHGEAAEAEMVVSTPSVDRVGDRVMPEGVQLDDFRRNPVLLWGHDTRALPIGTVTRVGVERGQGLRARWRWLAGDEFAGRVKNAWDQGVVRAASIGFVPMESRPNEFGGRDHVKWELMEISLVALPANAEATRRLKALGLWPERTGHEPAGGGWRARRPQGAPSPALTDHDAAAIVRAVEEGLRRVLPPSVPSAGRR